MDKKEILDILDNAKDERGAVPMRLVRRALDKLVQPEERTEERTETHACDCISRQAAIDALAKVAREKFNLSDEYNHYLAGLMDGEVAIKNLPSIQPEKIYCKDCRFSIPVGCAIFCKSWSRYTAHKGYCHQGAERRTDD